MTKKKPIKEHKKSGRKETITAAIEERLEHFFRIDATDEQACTHAGCSKSAYYRKLKASEKFRKRMMAAQSYLHMKAKEVLAKSVQDRSTAQANWFLERREKDRYSTRTEQKHEVTAAVTYDDLEGKPKPKTVEEARRMGEEGESEDDGEG